MKKPKLPPIPKHKYIDLIVGQLHTMFGRENEQKLRYTLNVLNTWDLEEMSRLLQAELAAKIRNDKEEKNGT